MGRSRKNSDSDELKNDIKEMKETLKSLVETVEDLKHKINEKDERIIFLEEKLNDMEQYSKKNNIIISGNDVKLHTYSHKAKDGSLQDDSQDRTGNDEEQREEIGDRVQQKEEAIMKSNFVKFASERLKVKIEGPDIIAIHTLKKRPDGMEPVLVKFGYNSVKRDIMSARKRLKGTDIYINDQLTKKNAEIEKKARIMRKDKMIHSSWTFNGRIFIKKTESSKKEEVKRLGDLTL